MIEPGKLRERLTVQIAAQATNSLGETVMTWGNSTAVWGSVEGVSAREAIEAGKNEATITHKVRTRYVPGLTQQMRFSWRERTLNIVSLLEYGNRSEHVAICEEVV
jgi:SPP1 family predicted phage head-tail adaptor